MFVSPLPMWPSLGSALSVAPRPSVSPSLDSYFLEAGRQQKRQIKWKHFARQEKLEEQIWDLKVKGQGHRDENVKIVFFAHIFVKSRSIIRFTSNQDQNNQRPILHRSSNTFHQQKCSVLWYLSVCLSVIYLSFVQYWNAVESLYFSGRHWMVV